MMMIDKLLVLLGNSYEEETAEVCLDMAKDAVLDYIGRLRPVQDKVKDKIVIVPRIYTNKPRTTGAGYKGMLHQPNPIANPDIIKGVMSIRRMHMKAMNEFGFSCADEMLYPENHHFLSDLISYVAVGARSVEDQQHRLTASGLDVPVGMKNPTSGDFSVMMNSVTAEHRYPIMTPPMMRTDIRFTTVDSRSTRPIAAIAPTKDAAIRVAEFTTIERLSAKTMAIATVSFAPEEMPRMNGPAIGLWKNVCRR